MKTQDKKPHYEKTVKHAPGKLKHSCQGVTKAFISNLSFVILACIMAFLMTFSAKLKEPSLEDTLHCRHLGEDIVLYLRNSNFGNISRPLLTDTMSPYIVTDNSKLSKLESFRALKCQDWKGLFFLFF